MLQSLLGIKRDPRETRADELSHEIEIASERQAMSSLYARQASQQSIAGSHDTITAARAAAKFVTGAGR